MSEEVDESSEGLAEDQPPTMCAGFSHETQDYEEHCDTEFGPQIDRQAWSQGDPSQAVAPYRERHSWVTVLYGAAIVVGITLIVAVLIIVTAGILGDSPSSGAQPPVTPTPAAAPSSTTVDPPLPPFAPDMNVADHTTPDGMFLQGIRAAGWSYSDNAEAIRDAHEWCSNMRVYGDTPAFAAQTMWLKYGAVRPGYYPDYPTTVKIVNAAVAAYCPDRA